ncbi:MAG: type I DNA topoisomerase [Fidelibacterota bacterium]
MPGRPLIVVESPTKARTITRYLKKEYRVMACNGHIKDLPDNRLGIDITNNFKPTYVLLPRKSTIIKRIKEKARTAPAVLIATDPDREGEAIAWHLASELNGKSGKIKRALFTEITPSGIKEGMKNLRGVDMNLVDAQQARRIIDRLVGFKVSEFLWTVLFNGLSAGRVQSVALRLVCERHREITAFQPREYWTLDVEFRTRSGEVFTAQLVRLKGKKPDLPDEKTVKEIAAALEALTYRVDSIERKKVKKRPYPPFITSTLQQEAASRLKLSPARTMRVAQNLYEGVDIGEGEPTGLITYMRTDSTRVSGAAVRAARQVISREFGDPYLPAKPPVYRPAGGKKKLVQGAHEAIRPTNPALTPEELKDKLEKNEFALYRLIWQRFMASQMAPMVLDQTTIHVAGDTGRTVSKEPADYLFRATGSTVAFEGFRKVYPSREKPQETHIPAKLSEGEKVEKINVKPEQHFTKPPPYFTDSTLIKELDTRGIGRPSTFAEIVSRLHRRKYVRKEKGKLIPTETGMTVNDILTQNLPDIFDVGFTARMERELDEIENGQQDYLAVLNDFYRPFHTSMEDVYHRKREIKASLTASTGEACEKCGSPMVIKWNRKGQKFMACSAFPECRNTKSLGGGAAADTPPAGVDRSCPRCGSQLQVKTGRFGRYLGCSGYPDCRHTEPLPTGIMCPRPGCQGEIVERTSKKKRVFYGCSRYPDCDYASWYRPVLHACEQCGHRFVEERTPRGGGGKSYYQCPECKHRTDTVDREVHEEETGKS